MSDSEKMERLVNAYLANLPTPDGAEVDGKVLSNALTTMQRAKDQRAAETSRITWRTIMTSKVSKLAAAAVIMAAVLCLTVFDGFTQPTWALDETIEALKDFGAVHVVGAFPGGTAEIWMRANATKTQSTDVLVKGSRGAITWTKDGSTYHYEPGQNTVYYEHAPTIGMAQWLGPGLLEMLRTAENAEVVRGRDPATGRDHVMLLCSLIDVHGVQSWIIEFDVASKLPVAFKQWENLDRSGPPSFDAFKVTYYEDLPAGVFKAQIPGNPAYVQKPLTVPDENIGVLSNPKHGLAADGMTQQQAAERILRAMFQAVIDGNLATLKKLSPVCETWGDEFLRSVILRTDKDDRLVEVLEIGKISETGHSKLGPIVALPVSVRRHDGVKAVQKMIVQFRELGGTPSCVVHGPYGLPREIE
ncbi:MAG: hypothetical protein JSW27_17790 [Phycisphaerales bacterium]|nr:MAG: hypothetical protein JSW27_17790 [Phycisphaerales bacterium]